MRPEQPVPRPPRSIPARGASHSTQPPPAPVHTLPVAGKRRTAPLRAGYISLARIDGRGTGNSGLGAGHVQFLFTSPDAPCGQSSLSPVGRVHTFPVSGKRRTAPLRAGYIPLAHIDGRGDWLLWPRREPHPVLFTSPDAPCGQSSLSPDHRVPFAGGSFRFGRHRALTWPAATSGTQLATLDTCYRRLPVN